MVGVGVGVVVLVLVGVCWAIGLVGLLLACSAVVGSAGGPGVWDNWLINACHRQLEARAVEMQLGGRVKTGCWVVRTGRRRCKRRNGETRETGGYKMQPIGNWNDNSRIVRGCVE